MEGARLTRYCLDSKTIQTLEKLHEWNDLHLPFLGYYEHFCFPCGPLMIVAYGLIRPPRDCDLLLCFACDQAKFGRAGVY